MSAVVSSMIAAGPWALLIVSSLILVWTYCLVLLVLNKTIPPAGAHEISIRIRPFPWPRIEVEVRAPRAETDDRSPVKADPAAGPY